ncbi:hypothetical protein XELAEV_18042069mg [Xenopus laevis]|uniref:Uncharacterized protein n=1 Tax=Xenopus laevis TaxID=8355 RepID=A0A974C359_XENLA|nr:hypothetical protein XELAEV_18042069mg [Xenopus laevis]
MGARSPTVHLCSPMRFTVNTASSGEGGLFFWGIITEWEFIQDIYQAHINLTIWQCTALIACHKAIPHRPPIAFLLKC